MIQKKFNRSTDYKVDIIIAVQDRENYDLENRIDKRKFYSLPKNFRFVIVGYNCKANVEEKIVNICKDNDFEYISLKTNKTLFNISKARNYGVEHSDADFIIFEDVDLFSHTDFYKKLDEQIKTILINKNFPFMVVPVSYLNKNFSEYAQFPCSISTYNDLTSEIYYSEHSDKIQFHTPTNSYLIIERERIIEIGGYDENYEGWGFEDSDFAFKLLKKYWNQLPREFYRLDTRPYKNQVQWRGWRSLYRIFGDLLAFKGIYAFHIWHQIAPHRNVEIKSKNQNIYNDNISKYCSKSFYFLPLHNEEKDTTVFIGRNPHTYNRFYFRHFTNPILLEENEIELTEIHTYLNKNKVKTAVFNNPYGTEKRKKIYDIMKSHGIKCYVVERGALPWSIYVDHSGFCAESELYDEKYWINNSNSQELAETSNYIDTLKKNRETLEPQKNNDNIKELKNKINSRKTLLVIYQSPSDTTTRYFCGNIETYDNFITETQNLTKFLNEDWVILYKNHPLSLQKVNIDKAINVDEYHINDLLELCTCVALLNSGVGVLALLYEKPVFYFGKVFYKINECNYQVLSAKNLADNLQKNAISFNKEKALKFINYLLHHFYSFANWERKERKYTDKANLSISININYEILRIDNYEYKFEKPNNFILKDSILFDRYRLDDYVFRTNSTKSSQQQIDTIIRKEIIQSNVVNSRKSKFLKLLRTPISFFRDFLIKSEN